MWFVVVLSIFIASVELSIVSADYNEKMWTGRGNKDGHIRTVRSTGGGGLFGSRPLAGLGTGLGLKPVTFDDIISLKDKIANMTAVTDLLNKAIEAERNARNALQSRFEAAKQKMLKLEDSVNPDVANFWAYANTCGGILVGQTGKIVYKYNTYCSNNERCVWTIRTNQRSKVKVRLTGSSYKIKHGFLAVSEISLAVNYQRSVTKEIISVNEVYLFEGPMIILTLYTDSLGKGFGFSLEFEGVGNNINPAIDFKHFHFTGNNGNVSYPDIKNSAPSFGNFLQSEEPKKKIVTFVISPKLSRRSTLKIALDKIFVNPDTCENVSVNFYPHLLNEYSYPESCCSQECTDEILAKGEIFLATVVEDGSTDTLVDFSWSLDVVNENKASSTTCGGFVNLTGVGEINYKHDTYYNNDERCVWRVQSFNRRQVKLLLITEGFEKGYDVLTVTEINQKNVPFNISSKIISPDMYLYVSGPLILVTFYSDNTQYGSGFVLKLEEIFTRPIPADLSDSNIHLTEESGNYSISSESESNMNLGLMSHIFIINPPHMQGNSLDFVVNNIQVLHPDEIYPDDVTLSIYTSKQSTYNLTERYNGVNLSTANGVEITSSDGILIVVYEVNRNMNFEFTFEWSKGRSSTLKKGEGERLVEQKEGCGGNLVGDVGRLEYKWNETYDANERCTWTIRSIKRSKITLKLLKDDFEYCCDYLIVTELQEGTGKLKPTNTQMRRGDNVKSFGSVIFLTFISDSTENGRGFKLEFESGGEDLLTEYEFKHHLLTDENGEYNSLQSTSTPAEIISTFVIAPKRALENEKVHLTITGVQFNGESSKEHQSLIVYTYDLLKMEENIIAERPDTEREARLGEQLKSVDGWFLIILKSNSDSAFKFQWNLYKP